MQLMFLIAVQSEEVTYGKSIEAGESGGGRHYRYIDHVPDIL